MWHGAIHASPSDPKNANVVCASVVKLVRSVFGILIKSFAQLQANIVRDLLAISTNKDHRVVVQWISEIPGHSIGTIAFCDPSNLERFGGWPMQVFSPSRISNTWLAGQTWHPRIPLEGVAVVGREDEYNMCAVSESIDEEILIFGLRAPGALALCCLDVLIVPTFDQEISDIIDLQIDPRLGRTCVGP